MRAYAVGLVQRNVGCVVSYNATSTSVPHRCLQAKVRFSGSGVLPLFVLPYCCCLC